MDVSGGFPTPLERGSTVTSNLPFDEWTSVFSSERRLTGALLIGSPTTSISSR
jgi:hypothetical protein